MTRVPTRGGKQERIEVESGGWLPRQRQPQTCTLTRVGESVRIHLGRDEQDVRAIGGFGGRLLSLVDDPATIVEVAAVAAPRYTLRFQSFRERRVWPASVIKIPADIVAKLRPSDRGDLDRWLSDQFAVTSGAHMFAADAGLGRIEPEQGFDLIGRFWRVSLQYEGPQQYLVKSIRKLGRRKAGGATLLVGELRAEASWVGAQTESDAATLPSATAPPRRLDGITDLWSVYSAEVRRTIDVATDIDPLRFRRTWFDAREKVYVLEVDGPVPARWRAGVEVAVPGDTPPPPDLPEGDDSDDADTDADSANPKPPGRRAVFAGTLESISEREARVRPARNYASPPQEGELVMDRSGDRKQAKRQSEALQRVIEHRAARPDLLEILEGHPDPNARDRTSKGVDASIRRALRDRELTPMQRIAVERAVATPDIAVIQGPPGTGKTTVLRAIVQALYDLGERKILICAQGHDPLLRATEELRAAGIPVLAFGGRSDEDRAERVRPLQAVVDEVASTVQDHIPSDRLTLREVADELLALRAARPDDDDPRATARWLRRMIDIAEPHLPPGTLSSARRVASELSGYHASPARPEWENLLAGLAGEGVAFADGGPRQARRLLQYGPPFALADLAVLRQAGALTLGDPPPEGWPALVARLQRDHLFTRPTLHSLSASATVTSDLLLVTISEAARSGRAGVAAALQDFLEDFRRRPDLVRDLLRHVAPAKGSTVGQVSQFDGDGGMEEFDTVIVDEAARANPLELFLVLCRARRIILLGDEKQLPHMVDDAIAALVAGGLDAEEARRQILDRLRETLFGRLVRLYAECPPGGLRRVVPLDIQFRSQPIIADYISQEFYGGGLRSPDGHDVADPIRLLGDARVGWIDVRGSFERKSDSGSSYRAAEIEVVRSLVQQALKSSEGSIGVISFYGAQVERLKEAAITDGWGERVHVGTVDSFQGREYDLVIVSCVRANRGRNVGFLAVRSRICVALSRAKGSLVCVGDARTTDRVPALKNFRQLCMKEGVHEQR